MADAVRNTIELNIYDEDLEIVKEHICKGQYFFKAFKRLYNILYMRKFLFYP